MTGRKLSSTAIVAWLLAWTPSIHAQPTLGEMHLTSWTAADGAPQSITSLAQGPDGSLWIGSRTGLFNFDGMVFRQVHPAPSEPNLPQSAVESLVVTKAGTVWVALEKGGLVSVTAGRARVFDTVAGSPLPSAAQLRQAPDGTLWATDGGHRLVRLGAEGNWVTEPTPATGRIGAIFVDSANTLWVAQAGVIYIRSLPDGGYVRTEIQADVVTGVAETPQHHIWINARDATTRRGRLQQIERGGRLIRSYPEVLPDSGAIAAMADGSILITSFDSGVRRLSAADISPSLLGGTPATADSFRGLGGLRSSRARAAMMDAHGNVWIGGAFGLDRLRPRPFTFVDRSDIHSWGMCSTTAGAFLLVNSLGEMYLPSGAPPTRLPGTGPVDFMSVACSDTNHAWFIDRRGVWSTVAGRVAPLPPLEGRRQPDVPMIVAASDQTLYVTAVDAFGTGGVWRYRHERWAQLHRGSELGVGGLTAYVDRKDRLWIGSTYGSAVLHDGDEARLITSGDPGLGAVHSFLDTSHGLLAAGTNGLAVLRDSRFEMLKYAEESLVRAVRGMAEARNGDLWLNTSSGFARVAALELSAAIADPTRAMSVRLVKASQQARTGVPHTVRVSRWQTAARDSTGHLWFSSYADNRFGLVHLNPEDSTPIDRAPKVAIRSITANGRLLTSGRITASAARTLHINYFGTNLTEPESVIYRYRLEGIDDLWLDVGQRTEALYTSLPPGTYTFHVMASNGDGVWTAPVSSAPLTVLPQFYRTWWFAAMVTGLGLGAVAAVHRLRVRQIARVMNARFDERIAERTRLARDLHDTLLQTVHGSKLVADRALRDTTDREQLARALTQVSAWLGQAATEGRAALQSLRASTLERNDLAGALRRAINECRQDSTTELTLAVTGGPRHLHPVVRDEIYRIGYEAIRNACVHAQATRIDVELDFGHAVTLRIRDDGIGIASDVIAAGRDGHFGLRGMRERGERIGATFSLTSRLGEGTAITLSVPGHLASGAAGLSSSG